MSAFKDMVAKDNHGVFLHCDEFAETRTIVYDGETYKDVPVVISGMKEKDRRQLVSDHSQGNFMISHVLHCAMEDLGGNQPEKGQRIKVSDEQYPAFLRQYYVAASVCEMGMLRVELEAVSE